MQPITYHNSLPVAFPLVYVRASSSSTEETEMLNGKIVIPSSWNIPMLHKETKRQLSRQMKKTSKIELKYIKACEMNEDEIKLAIKFEELDSAKEKLVNLLDLESDISALGENGKVLLSSQVFCFIYCCIVVYIGPLL